MNRNAKNSFMKISGAISAYRSATVETLTRYRDADERAKLDAAKYKDEQTIYAEKHSALVADARRDLALARTKLGENIDAEIDALRGMLREHIAIRPGSIFTDTLRCYADFDLQPTETELSALLELNGGTTLGLQMLNKTLEKVNSPYRIEFSNATDYEKDLAALEGLIELSVCYAPVELHSLNCDIYTDEPRYRGGVDTGEKWGNTSLIIRSTMFESAAENVGAMAERWTAEVVPSVKQIKSYKPVKDDNGEEISAEDQFNADREATAKAATVTTAPDVSKARQMGHDRAQADAKAREIVSAFAKGATV